MQTQGSRLLQVSGIIMIVFGAISIFSNLVFGGLASLFSLLALNVMVLISTIFAILGGVLELVAGILGAKNWQQPAKAQSCMVMAIVLIALQVLSFLLSLSSGFNLLSLIIGLVLPVLYLIGALQLKKA